ncbi:MAG: trigger factor [Lachnospiraceae bacterium]|nr:trigger factor [Lachnospiraceae bacterium]
MKRIIGVLITFVFGLSLFGATYNMRGEVENTAVLSDEWVLDESVKEYEIADYNLSKYVTLGDLEGITFELNYSEVTDASVLSRIDEILLDYPQYRNIDKMTAENGDVVNISYVGTIAGEAFDGGTSDDSFVTLGSGEMIPGFEEGILGMNVGETKEVKVTFPDNYYSEYAGKDAVFTITLKAISEEYYFTYEDVTDEFVQENFSIGGKQEFFDILRENLTEEADGEKENAAFDNLMNKALEISTVEIPEELLDYKVLTYLAKLKVAINKAGMSVDVYLRNYYGQTEEEFYASVEEMIGTSLKKQMILAYYAELNGIELDEEAYGSYKNSFIQYYGYNSEEELYNDFPEAELKVSCLCNQVLEHLLSVININYIPE